jgi:hypothetical protein
VPMLRAEKATQLRVKTPIDVYQTEADTKKKKKKRITGFEWKLEVGIGTLYLVVLLKYRFVLKFGLYYSQCASLVNTPPKTLKNKERQVQSSHRGTCTYRTHLSCICANEFAPEKANQGTNWRLPSGQVSKTECLFVCHVPGPRGNSLGYFCPRRASS